MRHIQTATIIAGMLLGPLVALANAANDNQEVRELERNFIAPPDSAKPSCFWWWFNNLVNKEGITRDLEEFKARGLGGVLLVCSANGYGVGPMPSGPTFLSPEWLELYRHALKEAARLHLEVGVNLCPGWCMGGPWITPDHAGRWFLQSRMTLTGPQRFSGPLPLPGPKDGYDSKPKGTVSAYINLPLEKVDYRDTAVVAFREPDGGGATLDAERKRDLPAKSNRQDADCFIPAQVAMSQTLGAWTNCAGDHPIPVADVVDLTRKLKPDGHLEWDVPAGTWTLVRTGHRMTGKQVNMQMPDATGLEVDWFSADATDQHFDHLGRILIREAGALAGKTLKYFHTDSFEDGYPNWTARLREHFKTYRGYDPARYLPVFAGRIVGSAEISERFLYDYRKTVAQCMADGNYRRMAERSHRHELALQCEAAGPSWSGTICLDALLNLGRCDRPMGEFWQDQIFVVNDQNQVGKQTASAAHTYGRPTASAEAFTSFLPHWGDSPASLKPKADRAFCEGINRLVFHTATATRPGDGLPGYEYGAGTHFNPNVTWWSQSAGPWLAYVNRCQALLQSGRFVADVLYYNGDWAPNLVEPKHVDPELGTGYDYDVCNAEVLLTRLSVKAGRLVLPDGMCYRLLVLPPRDRMPVEVLKKVKRLVEAGATVVGPRPVSDPGLKNYPECDRVVQTIAGELWGASQAQGQLERRVGRGRIIDRKSLRAVLLADEVSPDFESAGEPGAFIDFIHRTVGGAEVYFLANRSNRIEKVACTFRVAGRQPELWDPVTGRRRALPEFQERDGRTTVPLEFDPCGSCFVVFRKAGTGALANARRNFPALRTVLEVAGPWTVQFDPKWGGPAQPVSFEALQDWTQRAEEGIHYYSGTATYRQTFDVPLAAACASRLFLDLGTVRETARVRLNGQDLGVVWCAPRRVEITAAVRPGPNALEIEVVNLWPNRLIGDGKLPPDRRFTRTNVTRYYQGNHVLLASGLLGPVLLLTPELEP